MDKKEKTDRLKKDTRAHREENEKLKAALADARRVMADLAKREGRCRRLFETAKDGILLVDAATGSIIEANQAFVEMAGSSREEFLRKKLWEIAPLQGIDAGLVSFRELQVQDRICYDDLPFETKDGRRVSVELVCTAHDLDRRKVIQCNVRDITERKRLEEKLWKAESRFTTLFRNAAVGIAIMDLDGAVVDNNRQLEKILGFREGELRGKRLEDFTLPEDLPEDSACYQELLGGGRDAYQVTKRCIRKDGTLIWGLINASIVRGAGGEPQFVIRTVADISRQKRAETDLLASEERFRQLAENIKEVFWITTPDYSKILYVSPAYEEIWGRTRTSLYENAFSWLEAVIPEDRAQVEQSLKADQWYEAEFRIMRPDGTVRWIRDRGFPLMDASGRAYRIVGIAEDITERKRIGTALQESERKYRLLFENMIDGFALLEMLYDERGRPVDYTFLEINPAFEKLTGLSASAVLGRNVRQVLPEIEQYWFDVFDKVVQTGEPAEYENYAGPMNRFYNTRAFSPSKGRFAIIFTDVTERRRAEKKIREANELLKVQATTDVLTGIYNRLKFADFLDQEMREARRYQHPLSLIMFDVDHFKQINDEHGHLAGDDVLREIAKLVSQSIRHADIFARWGGEEFMILAPHSDTASTRQLADKIRSLIERHRFPSCPATVTCSFGITRFFDTDTVETFTNRVDSAMYLAKKGGRNRVEVVSIEGGESGKAAVSAA